jgi:hypothetical protein
MQLTTQLTSYNNNISRASPVRSDSVAELRNGVMVGCSLGDRRTLEAAWQWI